MSVSAGSGGSGRGSAVAFAPGQGPGAIAAAKPRYRRPSPGSLRGRCPPALGALRAGAALTVVYPKRPRGSAGQPADSAPSRGPGTGRLNDTKTPSGDSQPRSSRQRGDALEERVGVAPPAAERRRLPARAGGAGVTVARAETARRAPSVRVLLLFIGKKRWFFPV